MSPLGNSIKASVTEKDFSLGYSVAGQSNTRLNKTLVLIVEIVSTYMRAN